MRELTDHDVAALTSGDLDPDLALLDEVARCLADLGRGEATQTAKQKLSLNGDGFLLSLSAIVPRLGLAATKWASYVPGGPARPGRSTATVIASDATSGEPLALLTGMLATQLRTAAAAVAVARAARPGHAERRVTLVGFGPTNQAVLTVARSAFALSRVRVLVRSAASAQALRAAGIDATTDPALALADADLAFSATGAREPVASLGALAAGGIAVSLDGDATWHRAPGTPVLRDHGAQPAVPRLMAGLTPVPQSRALFDVNGCAVTDVALLALLLRERS
ncbi:hypothetical protein [Paractinoplanes durhamensis]|uniref:Ornithine cyclodeaminase n=1 Tax=Paractinoplanes durhamensis TaxID=113563 RepID=A0ABQ3YV10_9ACTN|nr:hypothetical protein [Actinoplanes durhamensis]GIE01413.1 hypothetical protein Adu01nite_27630 [Actinoplanes durhamensis]